MKNREKGIRQDLFPSAQDAGLAETLDDPEEVLACLLDAERRGELYPFYHRLRTLAPVHSTQVAGLPPGCFVLTRFRDVDRVARSSSAVNDPRTAKVFDHDGTGEGAFYRVMSNAMLFLEKSTHDRVRRLVYKAFTPLAVAPLRDLAETVANELIDAVEADGVMDFVGDFAYPYPLRAIMRLLGLPREAESTIETWAWDFSRAGDPMSATPEIIARGNAAAVGYYGFFERFLEEKRRAPGDDLTSMLIMAEDEAGALSRAEVISTLVLLIQAGHDTTADLLGNAMVGLFRHPDEFERLRRSPGLLPRATEELLRYDTSVQMSMRLVREEIILDGVKISAGSMVVLGYGAANRDPEIFPDPDRLDLDRDPTHLSFSSGAYFCLGNSLARTEIQTALAALFTRLPTIRPEGGDFVQRWTTRLRGPLELRVAWD
ncbi:MAG: cytochrome P450 [bacterium]|nr:cytochrome [Deltaproteobacteria bacterium]MCP4904874.1 cytochrome P450 [bacterium]